MTNRNVFRPNCVQLANRSDSGLLARVYMFAVILSSGRRTSDSRSTFGRSEPGWLREHGNINIFQSEDRDTCFQALRACGYRWEQDEEIFLRTREIKM